MEGTGQVVCFFPFLLLMNTISISLTLSVPSYHSSCHRSSNKFNSVHVRNWVGVSQKSQAFFKNSGMENLMAQFSTGYHSYWNFCTPHYSLRKEKISISISHYPITLISSYLLGVSAVSQVTAWLIIQQMTCLKPGPWLELPHSNTLSVTKISQK